MISDARPCVGGGDVIERARLRHDAERLIHDRAIAFHVSARDRTADAIKIGGDLAPNVAPVKIVEPGTGKLLKRRGKRCLLQPRADLGDLAVEQKRILEADGLVHLRKLFGRQPRLAARHNISVARMFDGGRKQQIEGHLAAVRFGGVRSEHPRGNRARHRQRGERPARRNFIATGLTIEPRCRPRACPSGAHQRPHAAGRLPHQPEAIAANVIHVRIDRRDGRSHREHRFNGVAAFGKDRAPVLDSGRMRCGHNAAAMACAMQGHWVFRSLASNHLREPWLNSPHARGDVGKTALL